MIRLFVGIALPREIRDRLSSLSSGLPGARWISPENMHMTLCFMGRVSERQVDDLDLVLTAVGGPSFEFTISGIETFGHGHRVHTLWAGVDGEPALALLQGKIEQAMIRFGLELERRKFTPHITLARTKGAKAARVAEWLEVNGGLKAGPVQVGSFILFRSHLGSGAPHYEALSEYRLETKLNQRAVY